MDAIPSVRLLAGEPAEPLVLRTIHRATGELRWELLKAAPLHDEDGRAVAAVTIIEDITRERIAELRDRFMARASETLMSSLDYEETLRNVAWLAVPEIADWCAVELVDERGARQQIVVAHRDPAKLELARRLRRVRARGAATPTVASAGSCGPATSELYQDIPDDVLVAGRASTSEHLSAAAVGRLPLGRAGSAEGAGARVRRDDAGQRRVACAASTTTTASSPSRSPHGRRSPSRTRGWPPPAVRPPTRSSAACCPTWSRGSRGGTSPRSTGPPAPRRRSRSAATSTTSTRPTTAGSCCSGDVTGKGVEAAALTSLVRHGARFLSRYERSPSRILAGLNEALSEQPGLWLCTALCVRLQRGRGGDRLGRTSAAPLVVRDDGRVREIGAVGPILGAWTARARSTARCRSPPTRRCSLYTDGVIDTRGRGRALRRRTRLKRLLREHAGRAPERAAVRARGGTRPLPGRRSGRRHRGARAAPGVAGDRALGRRRDASERASPYPSCVLTEGGARCRRCPTSGSIRVEPDPESRSSWRGSSTARPAASCSSASSRSLAARAGESSCIDLAEVSFIDSSGHAGDHRDRADGAVSARSR